MCGVFIEIGRQIDYVDSVEGTFLDADAATDAQFLADGGNGQRGGGHRGGEGLRARRGGYFDAEFAHAVDWTGFAAFQAAFLRLASVFVYDGYSRQTHFLKI